MAADPDRARKHLLARMAGNIAAGLCREHQPAHVAQQAVQIAELILKQVGL